MKIAILLAFILILVGCGTLSGTHISASTHYDHSRYAHNYSYRYHGYYDPYYYNYSYYRPVTVISIHKHKIAPVSHHPHKRHKNIKPL